MVLPMGALLSNYITDAENDMDIGLQIPEDSNEKIDKIFMQNLSKDHLLQKRLTRGYWDPKRGKRSITNHVRFHT